MICNYLPIECILKYYANIFLEYLIILELNIMYKRKRETKRRR